MQHLVWGLWMVLAVEGCPNVCKCSRKSNPEKLEVNCHKRGLRAFPSNLPADAWILKLGEHMNNMFNLIAPNNALKFPRYLLSVNIYLEHLTAVHR